MSLCENTIAQRIAAGYWLQLLIFMKKIYGRVTPLNLAKLPSEAAGAAGPHGIEKARGN
jgi:hypothetical protein